MLTTVLRNSWTKISNTIPVARSTISSVVTTNSSLSNETISEESSSSSTSSQSQESFSNLLSNEQFTLLKKSYSTKTNLIIERNSKTNSFSNLISNSISIQNINSKNLRYYSTVTEGELPKEFTTNSTQRRGGDYSKRSFAYFIAGATGFVYAIGAKEVVTDLVHQMNPAADVLALASVEVDLSTVPEGSTIPVKWRGKPLFIRHRTAEEIAEAQSVSMDVLPDKEEDSARVKGDPKYLVLVGVCTHLGCVPIAGAGDYNGWFCPCHGSHYDVSGRIRKGPAPANLVIPPYKFTSDTTIVVG